MMDADFCNALVTGVERVTAWSGARHPNCPDGGA